MSQQASSPEQPTLRQAINAVFSADEKKQLRESMINEQIAQGKYLRDHPEIDHILRMAIGDLVREHPDDAIGFLRKYFAEQDLEELERTETQREAEMQRRAHAFHSAKSPTSST